MLFSPHISDLGVCRTPRRSASSTAERPARVPAGGSEIDALLPAPLPTRLEDYHMKTPNNLSLRRLWFAAAGLVVSTAFADDMVSFATGGYATGLRTMEMMQMIDTNKDGMVSKDEWVAYQERVFKTLDKDGDGSLDAEEFYGHPKPISFATGGYAHGLETQHMFGKIDANGDGKVSHDEYIDFQIKVFEMMDTRKTHELSASDFIIHAH
jgi:Ca2+-binding EF-hand superfamily protein